MWYVFYPTKWVEAFVISDQCAEIIAKLLVEHMKSAGMVYLRNCYLL